MVGDTKHAAFEPAELRVDAGDTVVFVVASGEPHNVAFDTTSLSAAQKHALRPALHDEMLPFAGPLLVHSGDRYTLNTAGLPAGTYPFYCMTHVALHMRGTLVVR